MAGESPHCPFCFGRPSLILDSGRIARLRAAGASIREVSAQLEVSASTIHKALRQRTQNH